MDSNRKGGKGDPEKGQTGPTAARRPAGHSRLRQAVASLDAEDIALARLQAHVRRTETIHAAAPSAATAQRRTTVRLSAALLARLRERAKRDGVTASEVVEEAVERFLRSR